MDQIRRNINEQSDSVSKTRRRQSSNSYVESRQANKKTISKNRQRAKNGDKHSGVRNSSDIRSRGAITFQPLTYNTIDGFNLNIDFLRGVFKQIVSEGKLDKVFYDGGVKNEHDFLQIFASPANLAVFSWIDNDFAGMCWINEIQSDHCQAHYYFTKKSYGAAAKQIATEVLSYWFSFTNNNDEKLFKTILGITPRKNKLAVRFNKAIGMTDMGVIPGIAENGCHLFYLENETHGKRRKKKSQPRKSRSDGNGTATD